MHLTKIPIIFLLFHIPPICTQLSKGTHFQKSKVTCSFGVTCNNIEHTDNFIDCTGLLIGDGQTEIATFNRTGAVKCRICRLNYGSGSDNREEVTNGDILFGRYLLFNIIYSNFPKEKGQYHSLMFKF